jgi:hypothetical protein
VRDEALASVTSAVFVTPNHHRLGDNAHDDDDDSNKNSKKDKLLQLPSWSERVAQQQKSITSFISKTVLGKGGGKTAAAVQLVESDVGKDGLTGAMRHKFGLDQVMIDGWMDGWMDGWILQHRHTKLLHPLLLVILVLRFFQFLFQFFLFVFFFQPLASGRDLPHPQRSFVFVESRLW